MLPLRRPLDKLFMCFAHFSACCLLVSCVSCCLSPTWLVSSSCGSCDGTTAPRGGCFTMNFLVFALTLLCACGCFRASQAFVPSLGSLSCARTAAAAGRRWSRGTCHGGPGGDTLQRSRLGMMFGRGRSSPPQLSEEELADMTKAREEANKKVEQFLEKRRAEKEARKNAVMAEQREKVANRIKAEKEDAEHKKVYIPQRLEEIEQEEAKLQDKMSAFNSKIKDKEIKEL